MNLTMSSSTKVAGLLLALMSVVSGKIQITQPALKADTLALQPDPVIHWVYSSGDPGLVSIVVRQVPTDDEYEPMLALYRGATAVSRASLPVPLSTIKFEEGMNVTIAITEITEENQDHPFEQKVLASRGPLRLVDGSNAIKPLGTASQNFSIAANSSSQTSSPPHLNETTPSFAAASPTTDAYSTSDSFSSPTSEESAASVSPTSSNGDRLDTMTTLYITFLVVTAIPAFLFGFNP